MLFEGKGGFKLTLNEYISASVRSAMRRKRVTDKELAETLNISVRVLKHRFNGTTDFTLEELSTISKLLDTNSKKLLPF